MRSAGAGAKIRDVVLWLFSGGGSLAPVSEVRAAAVASVRTRPSRRFMAGKTGKTGHRRKRCATVLVVVRLTAYDTWASIPAAMLAISMIAAETPVCM